MPPPSAPEPGLQPRPERFVLEHRVLPGEEAAASELLARLCGLSRSAVKDAMVKGAVWLRRAGARGGERRLRRATTELKPGDHITLCHDPAVLGVVPPAATLLADRGGYTVWLKPAGLLAQGTRFGDHASLLRQAEKAGGRPRPVFPVHRLDREVAGIMVVAHTPAAARQLSAALHAHDTEKAYRAEVRGDLAARHSAAGRIDLPLDGRPALTEYRVERYDRARDASVVQIRIRTGRTHQIRRHLAALGHPVLGDPRYGRGNADPRGLQLLATRLAFRCPLRGDRVAFEAD